MSVSKGAVIMVGSLVGIPAGDWALTYGLVTDVCEGGCHAAVNVGAIDVVVDLSEHAPSADVPMSWEGKSIAEMNAAERATFHTVWSKQWIPVQYFNETSGQWVTPKPRTRNIDYSALQTNVKRRIKPSEAVEMKELIHKRREEIANEIAALKGEDAALAANPLLS